MRDRLEELQLRARDFSEAESENTSPFSVEGDNDDSVAVSVITPQAVVFEEEPIIENFLSEAQQIRDDITVLDTEVLKFTQQQRTLVATMRRFSVMKKESSITRDIKLQAESLHRRLDALSKQVQRTEDLQGPTAVTTRIQRSQHAALYRKFQQVMLQYNEGLLTKQDRCKHFIIRQLEVSGRDVTEEEVNEMVATGKWEVFNENLLNDARITRSQLSEIEQRHKECSGRMGCSGDFQEGAGLVVAKLQQAGAFCTETDLDVVGEWLAEFLEHKKIMVNQELLSLENNMKELRDLFMDIFMIVEEQGACIEHIQTNVERTQDYVAASNEKFKLAARYKKKNPLRQLCCCCCPPWRCCL